MLKSYFTNKFYEHIHEAKRKYSKETFLKKYIRKYTIYNYIWPFLFPLNTFIIFLGAMGALSNYLDSGKAWDLILVIISALFLVLGVMFTLTFFTYIFGFIN